MADSSSIQQQQEEIWQTENILKLKDISFNNQSNYKSNSFFCEQNNWKHEGASELSRPVLHAAAAETGVGQNNIKFQHFNNVIISFKPKIPPT